jgi:hypothetical protein
MDQANSNHLIVAISLVLAGLFGLGALRLRRAPLRVLCGILLVPALLSAGWYFWYAHRPQPESARTRLFAGVNYVRDVRTTPRALVIHVLTVDLDAPGIRFLVTPGGEDIPAHTVSQFLDDNHLQVAVNADYFLPAHDNAFWDYHPHEGDPVSTRGLAAAEGTVYTQGYAPAYDYATIFLDAANRVTFTLPQEPIYDAVSGGQLALINSVTQSPAVSQVDYLAQLHPRTAIGLDATGRVMIIMVVDGRQPNYSEGVSLNELADLLLEYGAVDAINLDGGGSSTLVVQGVNGLPNVLNSPIHNHIPGRERPIANVLGIYAGE